MRKVAMSIVSAPKREGDQEVGGEELCTEAARQTLGPLHGRRNLYPTPRTVWT
jgi:hypothetical protein